MSNESTGADLKTYYGNCHCGAFKFHIIIPELTAVFKCNCSICFKKGYRWIYPGEGAFVVDKGEETLKNYNFGPKTITHQFCPECGTGVLGRRHGVPAGQDISVNANSLMDVDVFALQSNNNDGITSGPQYVPAAFRGSEPTVEIWNPKVYTGSCHCGAITIALKTRGTLAEDNEGVQECDCSICSRNGTILIYPSPSQVSISDTSALTSYSFGRQFVSHDFCGTCGIAVRLNKLRIPEEKWEAEHPNVPYESHFKELPINLRLFESVEWDKLSIPKGDWSQRAPKYVCPK